MLGYGWEEYCNWRVKSEQLLPSKLEKIARHCVYFGRQHVTCHLSNKNYSGKMKMGQAKYANTVQRARNQGGGDFRIYGEITFESESAAKTSENLLKLFLINYHTTGDQNQTELYNILNDDLPGVLQDCVNYIDRYSNISIKDVSLFIPSAFTIIKPQPKIVPVEILVFE